MTSLHKVKAAVSLSDLANACRQAAALLPLEVSEVARETARDLVFNLIYSTPVDTSLALSNWRVGLVIPSLFAVPAYSAGKGGSTAPASRSAAYNAAQAILRSKKAGTTIYVSNNAGHIVELNQGKSKQQPTSFWIQRIESQVEARAMVKLKAVIDGN